MCGIAGVLIPSRMGWLDPREFLPMIGSLDHRGPDGMDYWMSDSNTTMLMHARLALVDLEGGRQPIANEDGTLRLVCNGEIYGYQDIMRDLESEGHTLRSRSDSEVIPHLFEQFGIDCFVKLRGEFAFALFDQKQNALYLVRDRFGIKPLFYAECDRQFVFGSELKAVLSHPDIEPQFSRGYARSLLAGITIPGQTFLKNIQEVPPGHFVKVTEKGVTVQPYWTLSLNSEERQTNPDEIAEEYGALFDEAVRLRLHGDAPVGAYLSSGVDSSAVVDSMARQATGQVKAFTIRFDNKKLDESPEAARVANLCGVEHRLVDVSDQSLADNFRTSLWHSETPVFNTHGTAKYLLSTACQGHVKAILTGEGADETLAGYAMYRHQLLLDEQRKSGSRELAVKLKEMVKREGVLAGLLPVTAYRKKAMVEGIFGCYPYAALRALTSERLMEHVFSPDFTDTFSLQEVLQRLADNLPASALQGMPAPTASQFISLKCDLPAYNLNFLGDRQEMANSIEGRVPFLDNELADFALSLPPSALMNVREGKLPLRNAMSKRLPNYIHRGAKRVFWAPVRTVNTLLKNRYCEMALSRETATSAGIFDPDRLEKARKFARFVPAGTRAGSALRTVLTCAISMHMIHDMFARNFSATAENFCKADTAKALDALYFRKTTSQ